MLLFLTLIPSLLWPGGPETAPVLEKAGIRDIAVASNAGAWSGTRVRATAVDESKLEKLDAPGVDYQMSRAGATAAPWINSNLWRMMRRPASSYVVEATGPAVTLAVAEGAAAGVPLYVKLKAEDLPAFASAVQFLRSTDAPRMPARVNFALVDDGSDAIEEVMNLLVRRNLLFEAIRPGESRKGLVVRVGGKDFPADSASDPYRFAAVVRSKIGDARRLVRVYGSETTLARLEGDEKRSRLHLIQFGRGSYYGLRVRVLGKYPRVLIAAPGQRVLPAEDVVVGPDATEFSVPELRTYAVVDLDAAAPGVLTSVWSAENFKLTADPAAPQWKTAPPVFAGRNAAGATVDIGPTAVRSRWTRDSLYLLFVSPYSKLHLRPEPFTDRDTPALWDWDVAEAFIGAADGPIGQYREYQVSPQGEWVDLDVDVLNPRPQGGIGWNSGYEVKARVDEAKKVWYGEMRIPLESIAAKQFQAGDRLRLGLFRCTGLPPERTFVAWQPPFRRSFHTPEAFGTLVLGR